jgi:hypothetical protein
MHGYSYATFRNERGEELTLAIDLDEGRLLVLEGEESSEFLRQVSNE